MAVVRTPGRRYWESHWHIRLAGFTAICMLASSVWFLYGRVEQIRSPHNPHYNPAHCYDCHEGTSDHKEHEDCYTCHDKMTRGLLAGAMEKMLKKSPNGACMHDIKGRTPDGKRRSVTALCLKCHKAVNGYVAMTNITDNRYIEIDIAETHPIGLMPTETVHPRTLPLSKETGAINCITCHDQHGIDRRMKMLRYYYPGNGHPPDFRPLCNDCHADGWIPMRVRAKNIGEAARRD